MQRERIVAAACGSQRIVVASYRREPGGTWWLEAAQSREVPTGSDWLGELKLALADARWALRRGTRLIVAPPPELVWLKSVRLPRLGAAPRSAVLRFELEQATPFPADKITGAAILAARGETEHEHLLCVLKQETAGRIATALDLRRVAPRIVPLAARLPGVVAPPPGGGSAVLVAIDPASTLLALAHHRGVAVRAVAHARMPADSPDDRAAQIAADAARAIVVLREQAGAGAVLEVRVAGSAVLVDAVIDLLRRRLDLPVLAFTSAEVLAAANVPAVELAGTLALVRGENEAVEPIDLTPPPVQQDRVLRPRRRLWAATAALLLLGGGALATRLQLDLLEAERRAARLERELAPLRQLAAERQAQTARLDRGLVRLAEISQLERARAQPVALLLQLGEALESAAEARIERLEWRDGSLYPVTPVPPLPTDRGPPPHLRVSGVVEAPADARGPALAHARTLVRRLAGGPPVRSVEMERFDDRHPEGVGFESDLLLNWENVP